TTIASVDRRSFPLPSEKVHAIGHGIDLDEFECREPPKHDGLRVLALGRYSPAKGLDVVLHAVRKALDAGGDVRLQMPGPVLSELERRHRAFLEDVAHELGLDGRATLGGPVPRTQGPK